MVIEVAVFKSKEKADELREKLKKFCSPKGWGMEHKRRADGTSGWNKKTPCLHWIITVKKDDESLESIWTQIAEVDSCLVLSPACRGCQNVLNIGE